MSRIVGLVAQWVAGFDPTTALSRILLGLLSAPLHAEGEGWRFPIEEM